MVITGEIAAAGEAPFAAVTRALSSMQSHPVLRRTSAAPIAPALSDTSDRGAFFASVAQALRALSEKSPLLFVIEDLHWAGGDTIALIELLERRLRDARIMIAASYRDEAVGPGNPLRGLRRVLSERPKYRHIALNALVRADVERLARERLGDQATPERIDALYWRTGGNALFLTESLETLASGDGAAIPSTISELVRGRYDELTARSQDAVERLAVAGAMIPMNVLDELFDEIDRYYEAGKKVVRDEASAAEARAWLAENEDETAMTPERMAAMEADAADTGEADDRLGFRVDADHGLGGETDGAAFRQHDLQPVADGGGVPLRQDIEVGLVEGSFGHGSFLG